MKTTITVSGDSQEAKRMVTALAMAQDKHIIEFPTADYETKSSYGVYTFYQTDRFGKFDASDLIDYAKEIADTNDWSYDQVDFKIGEEWEADGDFHYRENGNDTEEFSVEETPRNWEVYSSLFGDDEPAQTYRKCDYSLKEAIADYKENGMY
jgi:hypothetical protein